MINIFVGKYYFKHFKELVDYYPDPPVKILSPCTYYSYKYIVFGRFPLFGNNQTDNRINQFTDELYDFN